MSLCIRTALFVLLISCTTTASEVPYETSSYAVDGTTGTPLGGFGAGAVKFNANDGSFSAMVRPPADAYDFQRLQSARFQLFTKRVGESKVVDPLKAAIIDGRADDDAIWPLHLVNLGISQGVQVRIKAFSPFDRAKPHRMSLPYAFYSVTLTNFESSPAIAACALQFNVGDEQMSVIPGKGMTSKSWAICAASDSNDAIVSVGDGGDDGFFQADRRDLSAKLNPGRLLRHVQLNRRPVERK
jgi:hypothetical protein